MSTKMNLTLEAHLGGSPKCSCQFSLQVQYQPCVCCHSTVVRAACRYSHLKLCHLYYFTTAFHQDPT